MSELTRQFAVGTGMIRRLQPRRPNATTIQCMEVWGGNQAVSTAVEVAGLDTWILSQPYEGDRTGGDIHYVSTCGSGRVSRFVVADVSGHGADVGELATRLRLLMRKHVNVLNVARFAQELNREFSSMAQSGRFATAVLMTYFAPTDHLLICNAGHPRPLLYRASRRTWEVLDKDMPEQAGTLDQVSNLPLGIVESTDYHQFAVKLEPGDMVVLYTDSLIEASAPGTEAQLGEAGLLELIACLPAPALGSVEGFAQQVLDAVAAYRGGTPAKDDQTLMVLAHNGGDPPPMTRAWGTITAMAKLVGLIDY